MRTVQSCNSCFLFVFFFVVVFFCLFFCCSFFGGGGGGGNKTVKTFFSNQTGYSPMDDLATIMF